MSSPVPGVSWKFVVVGLMARPEFPRVFDSHELEQALQSHGMSPPRRTIQRALREWEIAGVVRRVAQGVYLNMQATPQPLLREAVSKMRPGAIVSLATVLGDAGVLNNPTSWVMAVLPSDVKVRHENEVSSAPGAEFKFAYLRPDLIPVRGEPWASDALEPYARVPTATPEKALLDWIYLSASARGGSRWQLPASHDVDLDYLDSDRLERLASHMGLENELGQFRQGLESAPRLKIRRSMR